MGLKMLKGEVLLSDVLAAERDTHDIGYDSGQKVSVYMGMKPDKRREATAYNNWLILAQRTSGAPCKIYLCIFNGVDAPIRKIIVTHAGDGRAAFAVTSDMLDKPSRMLQRRLIARFFRGSFDAAKELDVLISHINDSQTKINSMGKSPTMDSILAKIE